MMALNHTISSSGLDVSRATYYVCPSASLPHYCSSVLPSKLCRRFPQFPRAAIWAFDPALCRARLACAPPDQLVYRAHAAPVR